MRLYYRRIPSYDRLPSDGVHCPLGMELKCCDKAKVTIRSKSPTKPRRLRRVGSEQRRELLGLTPRPEQTQHNKKGEENTRKEKSSQKAQLLQKGEEGGGTEGGLGKKREEKENYLRQEKKGEKKLKRKREEENGGEEGERELKRKMVEEYESQPLEGEKEEEEEPRREKEEKANETETPETSEEGGEEELKVRRTTEEEKNQSQTPEKKEGEVELKREEKDNQAHLEKTEEADAEGERELRGILASRQRSGCSCKGRCREETCECLQAGIHCRHTGFLGGRSGCACSSRGCNNINTRRTGWRQRRQNHYMQAMARFLLEKCFGDEDEGEGEEEGASSSPGRAEGDESAKCDYRPLLDDEEDYEDILSFRLSSLSIDSEEEKNRAHTHNADCSSDLRRSLDEDEDEGEEEGASSSPGRAEKDENCDYRPVILDDETDYEEILSNWRPFDREEGEEQSSELAE